MGVVAPHSLRLPVAERPRLVLSEFLRLTIFDAHGMTEPDPTYFEILELIPQL